VIAITRHNKFESLPLHPWLRTEILPSSSRRRKYCFIRNLDSSQSNFDIGPSLLNVRHRFSCAESAGTAFEITETEGGANVGAIFHSSDCPVELFGMAGTFKA
jgi:hypothetical protein